MSVLRSLPGAGGTVHDLGRLDTLSSDPDRVLILSERSIYVLQNLVADGPLNAQNFAVEVLDSHYLLAQEEDPEWMLRQSVIDEIQAEVLEMTTVPELLQSILDELVAGALVRIGSPLPVEYHDQNLNAAAGFNVIVGEYVPSGEGWTIESVGAVNTTTAVSIGLVAQYGGVDHHLIADEAVTASEWAVWTGRINLPTGARLVAYFSGCSAGDDLYFRYLGHTAVSVG